MKVKAFICDVLAREFYYWAALSEHVVDIELISSEYHEYPREINKLLQQKIDAMETMNHRYDYILLGFGLCGNVLEGLKSKSISMVIPRAHDCITLFMGSKQRYEKYFNENTGTMFYVESWMERNGVLKERMEFTSIGLGGSYEELAKKYGRENAEYLLEIVNQWKNRYNTALYISNDLIEKDFSKEIKTLAEERNWRFRKIDGCFNIIKKMVFGKWDEKEFLHVKPYSRIYQTTNEEIIGFTQEEAF